jgi:hypothetical protein
MRFATHPAEARGGRICLPTQPAVSDLAEAQATAPANRPLGSSTITSRSSAILAIASMASPATGTASIWSAGSVRTWSTASTTTPEDHQLA